MMRNVRKYSKILDADFAEKKEQKSGDRSQKSIICYGLTQRNIATKRHKRHKENEDLDERLTEVEKRLAEKKF